MYAIKLIESAIAILATGFLEIMMAVRLIGNRRKVYDAADIIIFAGITTMFMLILSMSVCRIWM